MKNVSIIPARANSKGLPGKNFRMINGLPLISWSILTAIRSTNVDIVIVSSNCLEVEMITEKHRAETKHANQKLHFLKRPDEFAQDGSKTEEAMIHAIEWLKTDRGVNPEWVTLLQPTSPVRTNGLLDACCDVVLNSDRYDSLFTGSEHTPFYYKRDSEGVASPVQHTPCNRPMRQEVPREGMFYHDSGNVYLTKADVLTRTGCRIGLRPFIQPVDEYQASQIDTMNDFAVIDAMSKTLGPFL